MEAKRMNKLEIFDPAMCCSTGVCGPSVDPNLTRVASAVYSLEQRGFHIRRYQLINEPEAFAENNAVNQLLQELGPDALPIVLMDGQVVKTAEYPTTEEFAEWFGVRAEELSKKPQGKVTIGLNELKK
jgi:sulfur carrier protein ThiS